MKNLEQIAELALRQLDTAGYYLSRYGVSDKINRHNLIAIVMTRKERLKGEQLRLELKLARQRRRLQQALAQMNDTADQVINRTPAPMALQLHKAKALVF